MAEWKPIESAPKDGRQILIYTRLGYMHCALWAKGDPAYSRPDGWMVVSQPERNEVVLAQEHIVTHWRPLPLAPNPADPPRTDGYETDMTRCATSPAVQGGEDVKKGEHDAGTD